MRVLSNSVLSARRSGPMELSQIRCRPMRLSSVIGRDPARVEPPGAQQLQPGGRGGGEPLADGEFLIGDQRRGVLADRQAAMQPVSLGVVIDQHGRAVGVADQAVPFQCADLSGPAAGVHEQLDREPGFPAGDGLFQLGKMAADLAHDLGRDIAAGFTGSALAGTSPAVRVKSSARPAAGPLERVSPRERISVSTRPASWQVLTRQ